MAKSSSKHSGFHLQIETDNAAFDSDQSHGCPSLVSLLRKVCVELGLGKTAGNIMDVNGNTVGGWHYEKQS